MMNIFKLIRVNPIDSKHETRKTINEKRLSNTNGSQKFAEIGGIDTNVIG
jgi:hypothetical protein